MSRRAYTLTIIIALLIAVSVFAQSSSQHFGKAFTNASLVELAEVMSQVERYAGKPIKIEGKIEDVCQNKGCWLIVTDGERQMRVTFKDYGFFVPKDSAGKKVILEGLVEKKTLSQEQARHYMEESKSKIAPSTIKGPQEVITMVATGVEINNDK